MAWKHVFHPEFIPSTYWPSTYWPSTYWLNAAGEPIARTCAPDHTQVAVLGAGPAGLSAALALAEAGCSVCVFDDRAIASSGLGASPTTGAGWTGLGITGYEAPALRFFAGLVGRFDCDYVASGHFVAALTRAQHCELDPRASVAGVATKALPDTPTFIPEPDQWRRTACALYRGGRLIPEAGELHPAKLEHAMRKTCIEAGVVITDPAHVERIETKTGAATVFSNQGVVQTEQLLLTSAAAVSHHLPSLGRRLLPRTTYHIATEPLTAEMVNTLLPARGVVCEHGRLRHTYRASPDGTRLLFAGPMRSRRTALAKATEILYDRLRARLAHLRGARITHGWTSEASTPVDGRPRIGCEDAVYYCIEGAGEALATAAWLGNLIAQRMLAATERGLGEPTSGAGDEEEAVWQIPITATPRAWLSRHAGFDALVGFGDEWFERRARRQDTKGAT